ncbi:hypothetical protein GCM10023089_32870 [Quisquiliibacterium transsilvanicum]
MAVAAFAGLPPLPDPDDWAFFAMGIEPAKTLVERAQQGGALAKQADPCGG